jgi:general secretion pathway protein A
LPLKERLRSLGFDRNTAFVRLYSLWHLQFPVATEPCEFASQQRLSCQVITSTPTILREVDHPVVMELELAGQGKRFVTLIKLSERKAMIDIEGAELTVDLNELLPLWKGVATLVWKPPVGYFEVQGVGNYSPTVEWIRKQLQTTAPAGRELYFDPALARRVKEFQEQRGLVADGVVGPVTMIYLAKITGANNSPRLSPAQ